MSINNVTIKDVAKMAGVSIATVSLALSGDPRVNENTRKSVVETAMRLNYMPNEIGRSLRAQKTDTIAFIIPNTSQHVFSHPYFSRLLEGVTEVLDAHNYNLLLSTAPTESAKDVAYDKILRNRRADGIILSSASIADKNLLRMLESGLPVVYLGKWFHEDVLTVERDDQTGAYKATEHLIKLGRRRIAHLTGPLDHQEALDRLEGYSSALYDYDVPQERPLVVKGDFSMESGYAAGLAMLADRLEFDAVFAGNDLMAIGLLKALKEKGIAVPYDVAVVGFDDIDMASVVTPMLTTIRQPMKQIGILAAEKLIAVLKRQGVAEKQSRVMTELVIRETCGGGGN